MSDTAIATIVSGIVTITTMVIGWLTLWVKLKYGEKKAKELAEKTDEVEKKLDTNTAITRAGAVAAVNSAKAAVTTAAAAAETSAATHEIVSTFGKKLNGGVDQAIEAGIKPLKDALLEHSNRDEADMKEIRAILEDLRKRIK